MALETVPYSKFCAELGSYVDSSKSKKGKKKSFIVTRRYGKPLLVTRDGAYQVTIKALDETEYLMSSPANYKMLMQAMKGDPKKRISYESADALRKELGL